jgi:hypothetical protein
MAHQPNRAIRAIFVAFASVFVQMTEATPGGGVLPSPPPAKCIISRKAWCVAPGITHFDFKQLEGHVLWRFYGTLNPQAFFEVEEPDSCSDAISDQLGVGDVRVLPRPDGSKRVIFTVAFSSSGICKLTVWATLGEDVFDESYYLPFSVIRRCTGNDCMGESIGWAARNQIEKLMNK